MLQWSSSMGIGPGASASTFGTCLIALSPTAASSRRGPRARMTQALSASSPHHTAAPRFDGGETAAGASMDEVQGPGGGAVSKQVRYGLGPSASSWHRARASPAAKARTPCCGHNAACQARYGLVGGHTGLRSHHRATEGQRHDTIRKEAWSMWRFAGSWWSGRRRVVAVSCPLLAAGGPAQPHDMW